MGSYSRVRSVKLKRKSLQDPFGFTLRGGQEHGTGIFVSSVTPKSIADKQGLNVGDQILRVNGFPLSAATHKECLAVISVGNHINLKIRSVGMIPVKDPGEPLTWFLIENRYFPHVTPEEPPDGLGSGGHRHHVLQHKKSDTSTLPVDLQDRSPESIYINTQGQTGLGCCICRGPPQKPGIFVQSTKSNGLARQAGLRPGDQIIECNGHSFRDVQFAEAIYHLKASQELRLMVIKGGANDLFPGESSGYNSSASSVNGETIVSHMSVGSDNSSSSNSELEEALGRVHILSAPVNNVSVADDGNTNKTGVPLDRNMEWDEVEEVWRSAKKESLIIQIKGEIPPLPEQIRHKELQLSLERRNLEEEQRKFREEAQKLEIEKLKFEEEKRLALQQRTELELNSSVAPRSAGPPPVIAKHQDLAGALSNEILKRSTRREQGESERRGSEVIPTSTAHIPPVDDLKRRQHEQLIEEFKLAHRKMFAPSMEALSPPDDKPEAPIKDERASFRVKRIQKEFEHTKKMVQNHVAGIVRQRQLRFERQHQEVQETEREEVGDEKPPNPSQFVPPVVRSSSKVVMPPDKKVVIDEPIRHKGQSGGGKTPNRVEFSDRPESPSPDYSNSSSPELGRRFIQRKQLGPKTRSIVPGILKG